MMFSENLKIGVAAVRKAKFRSFFTMLGIIIGVVSVITIVSLGEGLKRQVSGQVAELGNNLVAVRPGKTVGRDESGKIVSFNFFAGTGVANLTSADLKSVADTPNVVAAVSMSSLSGLPSYNGKEYADGSVIATSEGLQKVLSHKVEFGTYFDSSMYRQKSALIGPSVADKMFNETVPIGKSVTIKGQNFLVQGVFEPFSDNSISGGLDMNNVVIIPNVAAQELFGSNLPIYQILSKTTSENVMLPVAQTITVSLKANHAGQDDFTVLTQDEIAVASSQFLTLLAKMIIGMASVTLFVGGIGIMNVMLVSVSERTREIGIRKSIGATNSQIRSQFMVESLILAVWGTFLGVVLSALINIGLRLFTNLEPVLLWQPILIASLVSIFVGVIFGVLPANKASKKDPIESLRLY